MILERFGIGKTNTVHRETTLTPDNPTLLQERRRYYLDHANRRTISIRDNDGKTIEQKITIPSEFGHYAGLIFDWDTRLAVSMRARDGYPEEAAEEYAFSMSFVDPHTGFLSNKIIVDKSVISPSSRFESRFANDPEYGNSYTQPPIHAFAAIEVYESFKRVGKEGDGEKFLREIYGTNNGIHSGLKGAYAFFENQRQNAHDDPLIGNIDPRETGRDTDHACDMDGGKIGVLSTMLFMMDAKKRGHDPQGKRKDWIAEKMREKYWLNDVMVNSLYVNNLRYLAQISDILGEKEDKKHYVTLANNIEKQILHQSGMWQTTKNDPDGFFYNLNKEKKPIMIPSITGLFPLLLNALPEEKVSILLDKMQDPQWFGTKYPIPSHPVCSPYYSEKNRTRVSPPWDGPVWVNLNHFLVEEGLVMQAERFIQNGNIQLAQRCIDNAAHIVEQTTKLQIQNTKPMEAYDADGTGIRVRGFMWSNLRFEKFDALQKRVSEDHTCIKV